MLLKRLAIVKCLLNPLAFAVDLLIKEVSLLLPSLFYYGVVMVGFLFEALVLLRDVVVVVIPVVLKLVIVSVVVVLSLLCTLLIQAQPDLLSLLVLVLFQQPFL